MNEDELRKHMTFDEQIKQFGSYKAWHPSGQLLEYSSYKHGTRLHGFYKKWYPSGKLCTHCFFQHHKLYGEYKHWHEGGTMYLHGFYKHDQRHGVWKRWFPNEEFKHLWENGKFKHRKNGQLMNHCLYEHGQRIISF